MSIRSFQGRNNSVNVLLVQNELRFVSFITDSFTLWLKRRYGTVNILKYPFNMGLIHLQSLSNPYTVRHFSRNPQLVLCTNDLARWLKVKSKSPHPLPYPIYQGWHWTKAKTQHPFFIHFGKESHRSELSVYFVNECSLHIMSAVCLKVA